eukprot:915959-Alexandrium_andersonii.AAC.1
MTIKAFPELSESAPFTVVCAGKVDFTSERVVLEIDGRTNGSKLTIYKSSNTPSHAARGIA